MPNSSFSDPEDLEQFLRLRIIAVVIPMIKANPKLKPLYPLINQRQITYVKYPDLPSNFLTRKFSSFKYGILREIYDSGKGDGGPVCDWVGEMLKIRNLTAMLFFARAYIDTDRSNKSVRVVIQEAYKQKDSIIQPKASFQAKIEETTVLLAKLIQEQAHLVIKEVNMCSGEPDIPQSIYLPMTLEDERRDEEEAAAEHLRCSAIYNTEIVKIAVAAASARAANFQANMSAQSPDGAVAANPIAAMLGSTQEEIERVAPRLASFRETLRPREVAAVPAESAVRPAAVAAASAANFQASMFAQPPDGTVADSTDMAVMLGMQRQIAEYERLASQHALQASRVARPRGVVAVAPVPVPTPVVRPAVVAAIEASPAPAISENVEISCLCPITQEPMRDPVVLQGDGQSYERSAIEKWLRKKKTSPSTGAELSEREQELTTNYALKGIIDELFPPAPSSSCPKP